MKYTFGVMLLLFNLPSAAQKNKNNLIGKYQDYFGNTIEIKPDSSFRYSCHFDLMASWSKGIWHLKNDTVYFKTVPIYDTLRYKNADGKSIDSFVLSDTEKSKLITSPNVVAMLSSGGQNRISCPDKLFYKKEQLFGINKDRKLIKRKVKAFWTSKKVVPWYIKQTK